MPAGRGKAIIGAVRIPLYHVDAFASRLFAGNPAAVCPLEAWLPDATLQSLAAENNLPDTAFLVGHGGSYELRWFTPATEVDLCGHATLASAFVIFRFLEPGLERARFQTRSGPLEVRREGERLALELPARPALPCPRPASLAEALGSSPREVLRARDLLTVFGSEAEVRALRPDMESLRRLDCFGVIATAPGDSADFVSRFFAPAAGLPEDPVTGSAHCTLVPYWARRLGLSRLHARQVSARGGELDCEDLGERVRIAGSAVLYLEGSVTL
jgi:PhzF family phenazine biosynthesis protein